MIVIPTRITTVMIIPAIRPTIRYTSGGRLCPDVLGPLEIWQCPADVLRVLAIEVTRLYPEADGLGVMLGSGLLALADCTGPGQSVAAEDEDDRVVVQGDVPES